MNLELNSASPTQLLASGSGLVLRVLRKHRTSGADVERVARVIDAELERVVTVAYVQVIGQNTPPMRPDLRRQGAALLERRGRRVFPVMVLDGLGFWNMTLRLGLQVFASMLRESSVQIEPSVDKAAELLAREFEGFDVDGFIDAYRELAAHMRSM